MQSSSEQPSASPVTPRAGRRRRIRSPRILSTVFFAAAIVATLFVTITPSMLTGDWASLFASFFAPKTDVVNLPDRTARPAVKIGIVSGHLGNDSGAVCENGMTEAKVNMAIATLVQQKLRGLGYETDLLEEKDARLEGYRAAVLVSIHNDSCDYINDQATGFKVAAAMSSRDNKLANRLASCMRDRYQRATNMPWHDSVTIDMTSYHAFNEIDPGTTAAIIETGFLNLDYDMLTKNTATVATGVADGIICYIQNENIEPTATPTE